VFRNTAFNRVRSPDVSVQAMKAQGERNGIVTFGTRRGRVAKFTSLPLLLSKKKKKKPISLTRGGVFPQPARTIWRRRNSLVLYPLGFELHVIEHIILSLYQPHMPAPARNGRRPFIF
jgi:hypothetical protein